MGNLFGPGWMGDACALRPGLHSHLGFACGTDEGAWIVNHRYINLMRPAIVFKYDMWLTEYFYSTHLDSSMLVHPLQRGCIDRLSF